MKLLTLALAIMGAQSVIWQSPTRNLTLEGFSTIIVRPGELHAEGTGRPLVLTSYDQGIRASAPNVKLDGAINSQGDVTITSADLTSGTSLTLDTDLALQFRTDAARKSGQAAPNPVLDRTQVQFTSAALGYRASSTEGSLTIPNPFQMNSDLRRVRLVGRDNEPKRTRTTDQHIEIRGLDTVVRFDPRERDNPLTTGTMSGPIQVHLVQNVSTDGKAEPMTTIDATAGHLDLDFTGAEHTITLAGGVTVNGSGGAYVGSGTASKAVIVFGPDNEIQEIRMTGDPTETRVRKATGGGGR